MLKRFSCSGCGAVEMVAGGNTGFLCSACREAIRHHTLSAQYLAHQAVAKARRAGLLASPREHKCADCGAQATEYDHRDYSQPLAVDPVCRRCNVVRGPATPTKRKPAETAKG